MPLSSELQESPDSLAQKQAILEYWMLLEFFSPYLLENVLDHNKKYQKIYANRPTSEPLPWHRMEVIPEEDPQTPFARGYHLYLGLFSIEETADRARHVFAKQPNEWQSVHWEDCGDASSITAFARLSVSTHGIPLLGTLSLSTLPWAHGALLNQNQEMLKIEEYWKSVNRLLWILREEFAIHLPRNRGNLMAISYLLQGKKPTTLEDTTRIWQSLFLLIPVISSTFASIGRLFRFLESQTLGWVLIDEAGQASPQSAVGAIWRAKRVFAIGDPFQIEPICQIPVEVVDGMAKLRLSDHLLQWAPSQISVQHVIDRITVFGSKRTLREESYWVSCPLRIHRRCLEPMFSISNAIAYDCSMHNSTDSKEALSLPSSCWWDVCGNVSMKQYVAEQGKALLHLLRDMLMHVNNPDLYVISPFRQVISQIQHLLMPSKELQHLFKEKFPHVRFPHWVRTSMGTVHAFQGKQAHAVFFVLGGDKSTLGAIEWASRKPNLLNVAVTRAKSRFYVIGDYDLWKHRPFFDVAAKKLERRKLFSPEESIEK